MGAVGRMEAGTEETAKTDVVNTVEANAEDTTGIGVMGAAGVAAADTPTSAANPSPLKGFANERNGHIDKKGRVNLAKKRKNEKKGRREER